MKTRKHRSLSSQGKRFEVRLYELPLQAPQSHPNQVAVEWPDQQPEFWAAVLPELDAEFVHPVRIGNV